jgi:lipopolysaccharide export system protein LptA
MNRFSAALGSVLLAAILAGAGFAAEAKAKAEPKKAPPAKKDAKSEPGKKAEPEAKQETVPVHIWADRIRYIKIDNLALATGNATAIKSDFRIDCENLRGILDPETNKFKKLFAEGDVHIYNILPIPDSTGVRPPLQLAPEEKRGTCQAADYDLETGIVILTGPREQQPVLVMNKDQIQADRIVYDQKADRATFEGRVKLSALVPKKQGGKPSQ